MKSDRSKIAHLPIRARHTGGVIYPPLNLRFPTVYRIVQSMRREQLDELGFHDEEPSADAKHYTPTELGDDAEHSPGKVEPTVLRTLDAAIACVSLVIQSTITDRPMKRCRI
jgi:hypothetical protein